MPPVVPLSVVSASMKSAHQLSVGSSEPGTESVLAPKSIVIGCVTTMRSACAVFVAGTASSASSATVWPDCAAATASANVA